MVEIVTLARALADAGEDGVASVRLGDVVDELHDEHGLADAGTPKETDLATLGVGGEEVNDLDAGDEDLGLGRLVHEEGSLRVDGHLALGVDGAALVNGLANNVDDAAEELGAGGHHDGLASVNDGLAARQPLGGVHSDGAHGVLTKVLSNLEHEADLVALNLQSVQDGGEVVIELDVNDSADNLGDLALDARCLGVRAGLGPPGGGGLEPTHRRGDVGSGHAGGPRRSQGRGADIAP
mmetsp:Transcript_24711/g.57287  ORF Transcript_24711/g.57287 Transcript_24711/m.57287 type:complete len:238 (-) Transcript_24711:64-777(-)